MESFSVIAVTPLGKKKYKILLEGTEKFTISLYPSEIKRYSIKEGNQLKYEDYQDISEILYKRGKERALYYLKNSDKTRWQIRNKLREGGYPDEVINKIIEKLTEYGFVDDYRFISNFISYNKQRKSVERMKSDLRSKGIEKWQLDQYFSENGDGDYSFEEHLIEEYCRKKIKGSVDRNQYNKIVSALMRKGFDFDKIKKVLGEVMSER